MCLLKTNHLDRTKVISRLLKLKIQWSSIGRRLIMFTRTRVRIQMGTFYFWRGNNNSNKFSLLPDFFDDFGEPLCSPLTPLPKTLMTLTFLQAIQEA